MKSTFFFRFLAHLFLIILAQEGSETWQKHNMQFNLGIQIFSILWPSNLKTLFFYFQIPFFNHNYQHNWSQNLYETIIINMSNSCLVDNGNCQVFTVWGIVKNEKWNLIQIPSNYFNHKTLIRVCVSNLWFIPNNLLMSIYSNHLWGKQII